MSDDQPKQDVKSKARKIAGLAVDAAKTGGDRVAGWALLAPGEIGQFANNMSRRTLTWIGIALGGLILLSANVIASSVFKNASADLTASSLYTISDGTRRVLTKIEEPIDVKVYFSDRLGEVSANHKRYFERVRALFERYQNMSNNRLRVSFINPEPFSDAEDRAVAGGLNGVRINSQGEKGYFGLVATNSTDDQEVVPFFAPQRERYLEYDMTKLVHKLAAPKKLVIGVMSGVPLNGGMTMRRQQLPAWRIMGQIRDFFEVEEVALSAEEIPKNIDVLMMVNPAAMTEKAAFAVDQFVLRGGRLLAFLDPVSEIGRLSNPALGGGQDNPHLTKLLTAWGVTFVADKVAGDQGLARRVQSGRAGRSVVSDYVAWLGVGPRNIDKTDLVTDSVEAINLATPGFIAPTEKATTTLQPIFVSTDRAMQIDAGRFTAGPPDLVGLLRDYVPGGKKLVLAGRVRGEIATAFPQGLRKPAAKSTKADDKTKPGTGGKAADANAGNGSREAAKEPAKGPEKKTAEAKKPEVPQQLKSGKINAIIVADSDMLYDDFWVEVRQLLGQQLAMPTAHNAVFVLNALENLSGGEALAGLRGRGVDNRPFDLVEEIRRDSENKFRQKERSLMAKLQTLQNNLSKVERKSGPDGAQSLVLSDADRKEIDKFRSEMIETRRELRGVKHALRADIENVEGWVKFINIALVPILIGAGGLLLASRRRRKNEKSS